MIIVIYVSHVHTQIPKKNIKHLINQLEASKVNVMQVPKTAAKPPKVRNYIVQHVSCIAIIIV